MSYSQLAVVTVYDLSFSDTKKKGFCKKKTKKKIVQLCPLSRHFFLMYKRMASPLGLFKCYISWIDCSTVARIAQKALVITKYQSTREHQRSDIPTHIFLQVSGHRIRLHFDKYSDCYDFWVNSNSPDIHPVGWCEKTGHKMHPPKGERTTPTPTCPTGRTRWTGVEIGDLHIGNNSIQANKKASMCVLMQRNITWTHCLGENMHGNTQHKDCLCIPKVPAVTHPSCHDLMMEGL